MQLTKKYFIFIFNFLVTFIFSFSLVSASGIEIFNFNKKENYQELSEIESKKIISSLPAAINSQWIYSMTEARSSEEVTATSIINRASIFDTWSYALVDLPAETIVNGFKLFKDYTDEDDLFKVILEKIEKVSVDESVKYINQRLLDKNAKISFGAMKGGTSGDNKEIVFQYIIVYIPRNDGTGKIITRFYSPVEIVPPDSKGSYGASLNFLNSLSSGEKLRPFVMEVVGETKATDFGNYSWDISKKIKSTITFGIEVPNFDLTPATWTQKYIFSEVKKIIEKIPVIGTFLANREEIQFLSGKEDRNAISQEIESVIAEKALVVTEKEGSVGVITGKKLNKAEEIVPVKKVSDLASKKTNPSAKKPTKKSAIKNSKPAKKETINSPNNDKETDVKYFSVEEKNKYIVKILQELIKRKDEDAQKEIIKLAELKKQEEKIAEEDMKNKLAIICSKNEAISPKRNSVIINEVAWMGSKSSSSAEWMELKNISPNKVNLRGWRIYDNENKISISIKDNVFIEGKGYVLLERGENAVPGKSADIIYSGSLSNSKESLYLFDDNCDLQDLVLANPNWPAGKNEEKRTMERSADYSWHTYSGLGISNIFGTPREDNTVYEYFPAVSSSSNSTGGNSSSTSGGNSGSSGGGSTNNQPESNNSNSPTIEYCNQANGGASKLSPVIINEVAWMGTVFSSTDEWIELKNITNEEVSLSGYQLLDKDSNIRIIFNEIDKIGASSFYLLERTDDDSVPNVMANKLYSGSLNDNNETIKLFNSSCELIDEAKSEPSWPAGVNIGKKTMERDKNLASWHSYGDVFADNISGLWGSPKKQNSGYVIGESNNNEGTNNNQNNQEGDNGNQENNQNQEDPTDEDTPPTESNDETGNAQDPNQGEDTQQNNSNPESNPSGETGSEDNSNGNETGSNTEEATPEDPSINNFTEASVKNLQISLGGSSNQVILKWDNLEQSIEYEIYYSIGEEIIANSLTKINEYSVPEIVAEESKIKATISDLYWGKEYHFAVRGKNAGGEMTILSDDISINTPEAIHGLSFKRGDYSNKKKHSFSGLSSGGWTEPSVMIQGNGVNYFGFAVFDANSNMYIQTRINNNYNLTAYDSLQREKWKIPGFSKNIFIGKDGTIYQITDSELSAITPSGKVKWKESFYSIFSKDSFVDNNGSIFLLVATSEGFKPELIILKDKEKHAEKEVLLPSNVLVGENTLLHNSEIFSDSNGYIYFSINNKLIKYKYGEGLMGSRVFETEYNDYLSEKNIIPKITNIVIGENGNLYLSVENALVSGEYKFNKVIVINSLDFLGDVLWDYLGKSYAFVSATAVDGDVVYIEERCGGSSSRISALSIMDGEVRWRKEWRDSSARDIIYIDSSGVIYIKNAYNVSAFNPTNINDSSGLNDVIYEIRIPDSTLRSNISVMENKIVFVFLDKIIQITK